MRPYTLTLFLLLAGLTARAQLQRDDWLISFSDRVTITPIPAPAGLSDQLAGIRTYPGRATAAYLSPAAAYLFREDWAVGARLTAILGAGSGFGGGLQAEPFLRRYFVNRQSWMLYGELGPRIDLSIDDGTSFAVSGSVGVHLPVQSGLLLTPVLRTFFDGDRVTPTLDLGFFLRFGANSAPKETYLPLKRGTVLLGASSFGLTQQRSYWAYEVELSGHYFPLDRLAVGLRVLGAGYGWRGGSPFDGSESSFTPGIGLRYYLPGDDRLRWFAETGVDLTDEGVVPNLTAGVNYFLTPRVAVEYGLLVQDALSTVVIGQSAGFRVAIGIRSRPTR